MGFRGMGVVESLEIMSTSPQYRPSLPPCSPGAKPPFEMHGLVMRRRSVTVVVQEANTSLEAWPVPAPDDCVFGTGLANDEARRRSVCVNDDFPMVCPCGFRVGCIAELRVRRRVRRRCWFGRRPPARGASGTKKQPANHGRRGLCDGRDRSKQPRLFLRRRPICQRAAGIPRGSAISGLAILPTRAAQQRNSRQDDVVLEDAVWWPAIQPPLRNSCEGREG